MRKLIVSLVFMALVALGVTGCGPRASPAAAPRAPTPTSAPALPTPPPSAPPEEGGEAVGFQLTSSAFASGEMIPPEYSCDGEDISPPLVWSDPPEDTQSFALIVDDPDAPLGAWVHWVLYNLPAGTRGLPQGVPPDSELPDGSRQGENNWRRLGYDGPCPTGGTHNYSFRLHALDTVLDLAAGATKEQLLQAMEGHILAQAELKGRYAR